MKKTANIARPLPKDEPIFRAYFVPDAEQDADLSELLHLPRATYRDERPVEFFGESFA